MEISYLDWHSEATPIVLLHGLGDDASIWTNFVESLGSQYHCIAPDLRSLPGGIYDCLEIVTALEILLDRFQWQSIHVIAHSWGGKIAAMWATQNPQRFLSLVLIDPVCGLTQPLTIPSLFIQPEDGFNRTSMHLQPYKTYLKNLLIQKVPGNHWPFLSHPVAFNNVVKSFLSR